MHNMKKKLFLLIVLLGAMPWTLMAQDDDLYFVPKKAVERNHDSQQRADMGPVYHSGSNRNVDEYNRYGRLRSTYQKIGTDSLGDDIIMFQTGRGIYPDSSYVDTLFAERYARNDEDFGYTRSMSRWDDFYDPWVYARFGWGPYWRYGWGWHSAWSPYYYSSYWYDPWYDPWFYGYGWGYPYYRYGWYSPYYGYGWGFPYYGYPYYGGGYVAYNGRARTSYSSPIRSDGSSRFVQGGDRTNTYTSRSRSNRAFGSRSGYADPTQSSNFPRQSIPSSTRSFGNGGSSSYGGMRGSGFGGSHSGGFGGGGSRPSGFGGHR